MKNNTIIATGVDGNYSTYLEIIKPGELYLVRSRDFNMYNDEDLSKIVINTSNNVPIANSLFVKTLLDTDYEKITQWYNDWNFIEEEKRDLEQRTMLKLPIIDDIVNGMCNYITLRYLRLKNKEPLGNWNDAILKSQKKQKQYRESDDLFLGKINSYKTNKDLSIRIVAKNFKTFNQYLDEALEKI